MSAASLQRTLTALADVPNTAIRLAAKEVERLAREEGQRLGPVALGKRGRRVKLTAVSRFKGSGDHVTATVWGRPTGPWVWATVGTATHVIAPKRSRGKQRTTRYLKGDRYAHPYGKPVTHPGARGRGGWTRVRHRADTEVPDVFLREVRKVLR